MESTTLPNDQYVIHKTEEQKIKSVCVREGVRWILYPQFHSPMLHVQGKIQGEWDRDRWKASYFLLQQNLDSEIMKLVIMIGEVGGAGGALLEVGK